jgi:hypothetical protein
MNPRALDCRPSTSVKVCPRFPSPRRRNPRHGRSHTPPQNPLGTPPPDASPPSRTHGRAVSAAKRGSGWAWGSEKAEKAVPYHAACYPCRTPVMHQRAPLGEWRGMPRRGAAAQLMGTGADLGTTRLPAQECHAQLSRSSAKPDIVQ